MKTRTGLGWLAAFWLTVAGGAAWAQPSADALVEMIKRARISDGFEMRMNVTVVTPEGKRRPPIKVFMIGQMRGDKRRLLIRTTALELVGKRYVEAALMPGGKVRLVGYDNPKQENGESLEADDRLYNTGLRAWDMFEPWWDWPKQSSSDATRQISGRECSEVRSKYSGARFAVGEVISCVDPDAQLALRTELYDRHHHLLRSMQVEKLIRIDSGAMAAKKLVITEADQTITEVDVYSGDEHYEIEPDTFAKIDAWVGNEKHGKK